MKLESEENRYKRFLQHIFKHKPTVDHKKIENSIPNEFKSRDLAALIVKPLTAIALLYWISSKYDKSISISQNISKYKITIGASIVVIGALRILIDYIVVDAAYRISNRKKTNTAQTSTSENITTFEIDTNKYQYATICSKNPEQIKGTVFFFHGNGDSIQKLFEKNLKQHLRERIFPYYNVVMVEYPSYSESNGTPYQKNIEKATDEIFKHISDPKKSFIKGDIIACGQSIGGYHAAKFAQKHQDKVKGLMLMSTYSNLFKTVNPINLPIPVINNIAFCTLSIIRELLCSTEILNTEEILRSLPPKMPVTIIHGAKDRIFDVESNAQRNYEASRSLTKSIKIYQEQEIGLGQAPLPLSASGSLLTR